MRRAHGLARAARSGRAVVSADTGRQREALALQRRGPARDMVEGRAAGRWRPRSPRRAGAPCPRHWRARRRSRRRGLPSAIDVGAARLQVEPGREVAGLAERRSAVVEIQQAAPRDLGEHGRDGVGVGGEFRPEVIDDPDIAGETRPSASAANSRFSASLALVFSVCGPGSAPATPSIGACSQISCPAARARVGDFREFGAVRGDPQRDARAASARWRPAVVCGSSPRPPTSTAMRGAPRFIGVSANGRA